MSSSSLLLTGAGNLEGRSAFFGMLMPDSLRAWTIHLNALSITS
jgi:hypothetical protein